jgi:glycosyltransferase involved in cell wall biosynthesis
VSAIEAPRPLLLGLGWPPAQTGGLDRYVRELLLALPEAAAVVVGPATDVPDRVTVVSDHSAPLLTRIRAFDRAATRAGLDADIVDAHFALYAALPVRRAAAAGRPVVVHFHGPWAAESQVGRARVATALRAAVERSVYRRAELVVTLSGAFGRLLVHDYGVSPWRIRVMPPGVDVERFTPGDRDAARGALGLPHDVPVVVSVRRLVRRTGVDVLLDAWAGIDDGRALLVIVGDGPERRGLEGRARDLGLGNVRFLGRLDDAMVAAVLHAAEVCVVPSTAHEGFGLVVFESLASGTPVIVTDSGGLPEAVAGLDSGVVVPAGDAAALRRRIVGALDATDPLPDSQRCRAYAERFTWSAAAAAHRRVYAEAATPTRCPRILFVDHCARLSGAEIALLRLVENLPDVRSHVLTFEDGPLLVALGAVGVTTEIVAMPARTTGLARARIGRRLPWRAALDSLVQVARLTRRFRRLRPDVVHANSLKACLAAGIAARLAGVPCVWHARDIVDVESYPRVAVWLVRRAARRLPRAVIANSTTTLASLRLPTEGAPSRVVIPDPLPDEFFAPGHEHRRAANAGPVIGMVGRLAPWKGQHVFLEAFARAFPDGDARAHVVGDALFGEDEYRDALRARAVSLGIDDRVAFRGFRTDVRAELSMLDVLVHASVRPEPFGQVIVEGMATGLPVVASNAGGPTEIIHDGIDGFLVAPGDADALAAVLRRLALDPDRRRAIGEAARATATGYRASALVPRVQAIHRVVARTR